MIRIPFFPLLFGFNKEAPKYKGHKGTTQEPRFRGLGIGVYLLRLRACCGMEGQCT